MNLRKIVGVTGSGEIGRDPFDPHSWSGSSLQFFSHCKAIGMLHRAFGAEVSRLKFFYHALRNFSFDRHHMRTKLYLDPKYYEDLTVAVEDRILESDKEHVFLQLGALYDVPKIVNGQSLCVSYNDGNIAHKMKSPYFDNKYIGEATKAYHWQKEVNKKLDMIFTFSNYLKESFINDFDIPEQKVCCVGAGANIPSPTECPAKTSEYADILFIGKEFERKGGDIVVKAFLAIADKHKNARLVLIGPPKMPDIVRDNPHDRILFEGFLSKADANDTGILFQRLNDSKLAVLPSKYEPFGIAVLECQLYGMPCISVNAWAFPEMIEPGVNGHLLAKHSVQELSEVLDWYLSNPNTMLSQGVAAFNTAHEKFGWDKVAAKIQQEISKL